mmetsp:Transcript_27402/g.71922  ORF Transcript_27402/g.71922 Transcript_27402/m.71922 type:complete len:343 (+) Transcript_27402:644-1672(+)
MAAFRITSISASVSVWNRLMATTTGTPNLTAFAMWRARFADPFSTISMFSSVYTLSRGAPGVTLGPPPCILRARTVATRVTAEGMSPEARHFMSKNFSIPMSAPKPASVTTNPSWPTSLRATLSAMMDELPTAMLANGPACTNTGVPSIVCISVGCTTSLSRIASAPVMPRSSVVTGLPSVSAAKTILPRRSLKSCGSVASARIAMISDATAISNCVSRVRPFSAGPCPTVILRRKRSLVSKTRHHVMVDSSMLSRANLTFCSSVNFVGSVSSIPSRLSRRIWMSENLSFLTRRLKRSSSFWYDSWNVRASIAAATRLLAAVMAWMSPVRCRLNSSMGMTWE